MCVDYTDSFPTVKKSQNIYNNILYRCPVIIIHITRFLPMYSPGSFEVEVLESWYQLNIEMTQYSRVCMCVIILFISFLLVYVLRKKIQGVCAS